MARGRPASILLGVALALLAVAALAWVLRACGGDAPQVPIVAPPPAEAEAPRPQAMRAARPVEAAPAAASAEAASASAAAPADAPGAANAVLREIAARPRPFVLVVTCGGRPVAKCAFAVERTAGAPRPVGTVSPGADGRYELWVEADVDLPAGVLVRAPGWAEVRVDVAARDAPVEVRLPEGGRVTGRVRRGDGAAIGGALVHVAGRVTTADAAGRFVLPDVALGRHEKVGVTWERFARSVPCVVVLTHPGETRDVEVVVDEEVSLRVRVVRAADGVPVAGVHVTAELQDGESSTRDQKDTDAEGRAVLSGLGDGILRVWAWSDEIEVAAEHRVEVPRDEELVLKAEPYVLRRCAGRVVDPSGKPVAGVTVSLYAAHAANQHKCVTGKDGAFRFDGLRRFSWSEKDGSPGTSPGTDVLALSLWGPGNVTDMLHVWGRFGDDLDIVWAPKATLAFVVKDPSGAPLPDVHLEYATPDGGVRTRDVKFDGKTSARRVTWFERLPVPGRLTVQGSDGRRTEVEVTPQGAEKHLGEVLLAPSGELRLEVSPPLDAEGVEVARRTESAEPSGNAAAARRVGWATRRGGVFVLPAIAAGTHRLVVSARGRLAVEVREVTIRARETTTIAVTLPRPASLAVLVRRGDRVVEGAAVALEVLDAPPGTVGFLDGPSLGASAREGETALSRKATTSPLGLARFTRLPPGRLRIVVTSPDGATRTVERPLADGELATAEIDLDAGK